MGVRRSGLKKRKENALRYKLGRVKYDMKDWKIKYMNVYYIVVVGQVPNNVESNEISS